MPLHHEFIQVAKKYSDKIAVRDTNSGSDVTYGKLLIISLLLAKRIEKYPEKNIGVMVPTSVGCIAAVIGILMAGKTPVMINYSTGAIENSLYAQRKCNFRTILTSKKLLDKLGVTPITGMVMMESLMNSIGTIDKLSAAAKSKLPAAVLIRILPRMTIDDNSVILFTSGSEKDPKAVQLSHKNILHNVNSFPKVIDISEKDVFLANLPLFHVFGLTVTLWLPLLTGAEVVTIANPLDYKMICDSCRKYRVSVLVGTPTFFHGYLKKAQQGDFNSLKLAIAGADKLPVQTYEEYLRVHGVTLFEGYGTTETSPVISTNTPKEHRFGSTGKPIPGVQVKIVDRETDQELPPNKEGKILVKGDLVMKGYFGDLEETSLRIRNGWYDTGDIGKIDEDGFIWHCGRLKRFVKIGGEMISLTKVEAELEKLLPDETICCVVEVPNPSKGAEIVAAVTTQEIPIKHLQKLLKKSLPALAIPKEFYVMENLPMMSSGKVNFREVETICRELHEKKGKK